MRYAIWNLASFLVWPKEVGGVVLHATEGPISPLVPIGDGQRRPLRTSRMGCELVSSEDRGPSLGQARNCSGEATFRHRR